MFKIMAALQMGVSAAPGGRGLIEFFYLQNYKPL
jgi:hypothetical protein